MALGCQSLDVSTGSGFQLPVKHEVMTRTSELWPLNWPTSRFSLPESEVENAGPAFRCCDKRDAS